MNLRCLILIQAVCLAAFAVEDAVELKPVHASVSYIYMRVDCVANTDTIAQILVTWIAPDSAAEKAGLRVGDRLIAINGAPVAGKRRNQVVTDSGRVAIRGTDVTFTGRRGIFRTKWSLIANIDAHGTMKAIGKNEGSNQPQEPTAAGTRGSP